MPGKVWSILRRWVVGCVGVLLLPAFSPVARAHTQSTAYLTLRLESGQLAGEWHLALRDLQDSIGLDNDDDGAITWGEVKTRSDAIRAYALSRLHIQLDSTPGIIHMTELLVEEHSDGAYAVFRFVVNATKNPSRLAVDYRAFFDMDSKHRGLLRIEDRTATRVAVFTPETPLQDFALAEDHQVSLGSLAFVREGIWHIWRGYDHILFLLALLLPGVLRRNGARWEPVASPGTAIANVLKIVTAFTVAHSLTLSAAALGIVHLPTRLIESAIAASVALAALNNLFPFFSERGWLVAFGFGLLHGFGFANALSDLGLHSGNLAVTLLGFNLGVELGQLAIVALFLPLALCLRRLMLYPRMVLRFGSACILLISATWLAERMLDFKWLPF